MEKLPGESPSTAEFKIIALKLLHVITLEKNKSNQVKIIKF